MSWLTDITRLESPEALLILIVLIPLAIWGGVRKRPAMRFSSSIPLEPVRPTLRSRLGWVPTALRVLSVTLLAIALARPQHGYGETKVKAEGVAIMTVVDRSWSMTERMEYQGKPMSRIDVVKKVFRDFVLGNGKDLPGRPYDMIGLVSFARFADTVCPLVRSHDVLAQLVDSIKLVHPQRDNYEAGTAIGEGLALAAARLEKAEQQIKENEKKKGERGEDADSDFKIKSKIIILLTDGDENIKTIPAEQAAQICKQAGIKVYCIGIGGGEDRGGGFFSPGPQYPFDGHDIKRVAEITGGVYRVVEDGEALRDVYAEIDRQQKTTIESIEHTSYAERFMPWAMAGAGLLMVEVFLRATWLRRSP